MTHPDDPTHVPTLHRPIDAYEQRALTVLCVVARLNAHAQTAARAGDRSRVSELLAAAEHFIGDHLDFALADNLAFARGIDATADEHVEGILTALGPRRFHDEDLVGRHTGPMQVVTAAGAR